MKIVRAAVVQSGPIAFDLARTLEKTASLVGQAAAGADLVVFPEAYISAYPKGIDFGTVVGARTAEGRVWFRRYFESSIDVPGPAVDALGAMARDNNVHLRSVLAAGPVETVDEDESGLPSLDDSEYQAHARASNKPVFSLHFVNMAGEVRSFQYVHLDSNSHFTAERITLQFMGMEPVRAVIDGRNLWKLYDYIHQHRMAWVMECAPKRDFSKDGETIVTRISIALIDEDEAQ